MRPEYLSKKLIAPIPTKDGGTLRTIQGGCKCMAAISNERELALAPGSRADRPERCQRRASSVAGTSKPSSGCRAARQAHCEDRTFARLAGYGHVATHHARELPGNGKAEPGAAVAARGQGIGLGEILKQFRLLLRRHADAGIRDGKLHPLVSVRHLAHPQRDLALLRELTGIT